MKKLILFFAAFSAALVTAAPLEVVKNGKSDYVIVVPGNALPGPREAAKELQYLIHRATGAKLPIVSAAAGKKAIFLSTAKGAAPESCTLKTRKGDLHISGDDGSGNPRRFAHTEYNRAGTWFGVNYIAERFL